MQENNSNLFRNLQIKMGTSRYAGDLCKIWYATFYRNDIHLHMMFRDKFHGLHEGFQWATVAGYDDVVTWMRFWHN